MKRGKLFFIFKQKMILIIHQSNLKQTCGHFPEASSFSKRNFISLILVVVSLIFISTFFFKSKNEWLPIPDRPGFEINKDTGEGRLAPKFATKIEGKRQKHLNHKENVIQYALLVIRPGFYRCDRCHIDSLFMYTGEVWKYGVTAQQTGPDRYRYEPYERENFQFQEQFQGTRQQCEDEENRKLTSYPGLPENTKRGIDILVLPPGNKITR